MTRFTAPKNKAEKTAKKAGLKVEVTRKKQDSVSEEPAQYLGLCMTCIHTKDCGFRRDVSQAVLECDEFDIGQTPETAVIEQPAAQQIAPSTEFKGLCINCDLRQECKFPKPAEGVWHCEEYV